MAPFSVINVHVLENLGPFGGCTGEGCLFKIGLFYAEISFVGDREPCQTLDRCRPVSASVGIKWTSKELESFQSAEEAYLLDKRTYIEINPLSASDDTVPS